MAHAIKRTFAGFVALVLALSIYGGVKPMPVRAQTCNDPSGFAKFFGPIPLGDILIIGPSCQDISDGGPAPVASAPIVPNIAQLRLITAGAYQAINVLGYYTAGDGGGGQFIWNAIVTTADNGGTIISSGGTAGRWIRVTPQFNQVSPEMFGALHNGTFNDGVPIDNAMLYLSGLAGGGNLQGSCGVTYHFTTLSPNGVSLVRLFSEVNIYGCGDNTIFAAANNINTSSSFFFDFFYNTNTLNNSTIANLLIDFNGANNSCGGTCYHSNVGVGAVAGDGFNIINVHFLNNPGSNDIVVGQNVNPPTFTNVEITGDTHENSGDTVNPASVDFSANFFIAINVVLSNSRYSNGPRINGAAYEGHGYGFTITNQTVTDYFNCGILSNLPTGFASTSVDLSLSNSTCRNVKTGIQVYSFTGATLTNVNITGVTIDYLTGFCGTGIDAWSNMLAASASNANLNVTGSVVNCSTITPSSSTNPAMAAAYWLSANFVGNTTYNSQGAGIALKASVAGGSFSAVANQIINPGRTTNATFQVGIEVDSTSAITAGVINIMSNPITGTVVNGVSGAQNAAGGLIFANVAPGNTGGVVNYTGSGVSTFWPVATTSLNGVLQAAQEPAHTGGCTNTAGSLALSCSNITNMPFSAGNLVALSTGTYYFTYGDGVGNENVVALPMSKAGTFKNMRASTFSGPGGAATYAVTFRKNGVNQSLTCTMAAAATTCNDLSDSFTWVANDLISVQLVVGAGAANASGFNVVVESDTTSP